jgi:glycosyltransferase involved in cell wall biosynthesis
VFIGAGNYVPYKKRFKGSDVSKETARFLGYLKERSELIEYFRSSRVYVAPTLCENLLIRVFEAMACGVPVVASNVCGCVEVYERY